MIIFIPPIIFFTTALTLVILRITRPSARYTWLIAVGGALLALVSVLAWQTQIPVSLTFLTWEPRAIFTEPIIFQSDGISWPYSMGISALTLTVLLTAISHPASINPYAWAGSLALGGLGLLAVTANNPITLLLVWAALDFTELIIQLYSVEGSSNNEKVVVSFSSRALGIGVLLWANVVSISAGEGFDFTSTPMTARLLLILAAGLRLGVLPLHLPYSSESSLRRGFGTSLRLVSAASSLILLARVPSGNFSSIFTIPLIALALIAAIYGGWMWLRAPDELLGRPYWIIGIAALSVTSALAGNTLGAIAWGCALLLAGGTLFLASVHQVWLNRILLISVFSVSSMPYSLTAVGWSTNLGLGSIIVLVAQSFLMAGFIRHALRPGLKESLDSQPNWTRTIYPLGIGLLIFVQILIGLFGWEGARQIGNPGFSLATLILTLALIWATPRFRILTPTYTHWINPVPASMANLSSMAWGLYRTLGRISEMVNSTLEGDGGIMWTLLFLVLFVSIMSQGLP